VFDRNRWHICDCVQVHPYTFRNEEVYLHFDFHVDPYQEYAYWTNVMGVDGFFTDFTRTLRLYQDWTSPLNVTKAKSAAELISKIAGLVDSFDSKWDP
jgi:glycerophosphoryl diester phosphodiesterase